MTCFQLKRGCATRGGLGGLQLDQLFNNRLSSFKSASEMLLDNDRGRFVTTYNSEYLCQKQDGGDVVLCTLSMKMSEPMPAKNEKMKGKPMMSVKGGKRRGEKVQQGWKVTKGARERIPGGCRGNFGNTMQLGKMTCSKYEDKSTQSMKMINGGLGKPSRGKSDVFLNIVQKAFDPPPPPLFEHLSYFAGGVF